MGDSVGGKLRNVALVGHGGAGMTTLLESFLFYTKATKRLGDVDAGQSNLDYDVEEINRKFTLNLALAPITYKGVKINLIDTPGYADFIGDAIAGMRAAEIALFVVDAVSGPQVTTDRLWAAANDMNMPRAIFMNRMDKEHADYKAAVQTLRARYGKSVVPVQIPIGAEADFKGIVDIITQQAFYYDAP
jgi:elongation factor G